MIVVVILLQVFCENVVAAETTYPQMLDRNGLNSLNLGNTGKNHSEAFRGVYVVSIREKKKLLKVKSRTRSRSLSRISVKVPILSLSAY